jgi:hypothetical protein
MLENYHIATELVASRIVLKFFTLILQHSSCRYMLCTYLDPEGGVATKRNERSGCGMLRPLCVRFVCWL